jgi:hypothetical protein
MQMHGDMLLVLGTICYLSRYGVCLFLVPDWVLLTILFCGSGLDLFFFFYCFSSFVFYSLISIKKWENRGVESIQEQSDENYICRSL